MEWFPAPPNTSATFLNHRGGLAFEVRDGDDKDTDNKRISRLYSLSAASEEELDSSPREGKKRDRKESTGRNNSATRSPDWTSKSREKRDGESRRSSLDENQMQKSFSSWARVDSQKSSFSGPASKRPGNRMRFDSRNSLDDGRYESQGRDDVRPVAAAKGEEASARRAEGNGSTSLSNKSESGGHPSEQGAGPKKDLPANLLSIFNQIAQFEKEKGVKPKK